MEQRKPSGVLISVVNNKLRLSPKSTVTPDFLKSIQMNKQKIVKYLENLNARVHTIPLKELSERNIAIKVNSRTLNEDIFIVSNEKTLELVADEGLVTYLPQELLHLTSVQTTPDEIKKIHMIKELFPGSRIKQESLMISEKRR
jgi:hypothetical protein